MIIFTSGTTSCPKGVELTHANLIFAGRYGEWQCGLVSTDRLLTTMPAFHSNFQTAALMPVLTAGATLVMLEKYSARRYWSQVRAYRATAIQLVAMMARTMMMQPSDPADRDHCVRSVQYYLPMADSEKEAFERRFGARLQNCYGSTETVCWVLTDRVSGPRRWPSVGRPGPSYEVTILNEEGQRAAAGEVGDIAVRGIPGVSLMKGYYRDEAATAAALDDGGWHLPGDKGYCDGDGWFYFVDRKGNMIKRAGENISASEVEEVLADHPAVAEAAVVGVPDPVRDMAVKAFVVPITGCEVPVEEITAYCSCRLADFKVPTIVEIVDSLPHTSVGKVEKKRLG
jgi:crotonobetaine/carnitine-CoA ligase